MADDTNPLDETLRLMAEANADQRRRYEDDREWRAWLQEREPTLRDRFAMAALTGIYLHPTFADSVESTIATAAYDMADAMIKAREARRG